MIFVLIIIAIIAFFAIRNGFGSSDFIEEERGIIATDEGPAQKDAVQPPKVQIEVEPVYSSRERLLTNAEHFFYNVLVRSIAGSPYIIAIKPRLADIVFVDTDDGSFWKHFSAIAQKHCDFVLLHEESMAILLVIELDDSSHKRSLRANRDHLVDKVLKDAGIPVYHQPWQRSYSVDVVRDSIESLLRSNTKIAC